MNQFSSKNTTKHKARKRVGRGIAAGGGKTAGRGTKGQNSRSGGKVRLGFEGGQNPFIQRIPKKRGFTSHRKPGQVVTTAQLERANIDTVNNQALYAAGLVDDPYRKVKLIHKGKVTRKLAVQLQAASLKAIAEIEQAGGSYTETPLETRVASSTKKSKKN